MWLFRELALWWWVYWPSSLPGLLLFLLPLIPFYACRGNGRISQLLRAGPWLGPMTSFLLTPSLPESRSLFSPSLQQSLSSGSSCVAQRKLNHKAWLMNRIGKESWGLLTALQRGGQAPEARGSNSRRSPQRSGFLRPAPRAFSSQAMWLEFPPLFFKWLNFPVSFGKPGLCSSFFFHCLSHSLYIYISPLSHLSPSVFNGTQCCLNKESVKNLLYMTSVHHNRRQLRLPAAQPREKMSTWPTKPRKFCKNNS